jgi:CBS domain-containing protein
MITVEELARAAHDLGTLQQLVVAQDLATPAEAVMPQDLLISVIQKMSARGVAALPVLDPKTGTLIGIVARAHILSAYDAAQRT